MTCSRIRFSEVFGAGPVFLPVIHIDSGLRTTIRNVEIARRAGAHGIFLIAHSFFSMTLIEHYKEVRRRHADLWIGLNFLREGLLDALEMLPPDANGLWSDENGISETNEDPDFAARIFRSAWCGKEGWTERLWFGGFDFKHQPESRNKALVASLAVRHTDVLTTSGIRTGKGPATEKIVRIRTLAGDHPLANASGTTIDNVPELMGAGVDAFLVSTGISKPQSDEFDPEKAAVLGELIRTSGG